MFVTREIKYEDIDTVEPDYLFESSRAYWKTEEAVLNLCGIKPIEFFEPHINAHNAIRGDGTRITVLPKDKKDIIIKLRSLMEDHFSRELNIRPREFVVWAKTNSWCAKNLNTEKWDEHFTNRYTAHHISNKAVEQSKISSTTLERNPRKKRFRWSKEQKMASIRARNDKENTSWIVNWEDEKYNLKEVGINSSGDFRRCFDAARKSRERKRH